MENRDLINHVKNTTGYNDAEDSEKLKVERLKTVLQDRKPKKSVAQEQCMAR